MDYANTLLSLENKNFQKVINSCNTFEKGAIIYAKEITKDIFLLFVFVETEANKCDAFIANFDCIESIGIREPIQIILYLAVTKQEDLHCLEKYITF